MLLDAKIYWPEAITTMLWPYALKEFAETFNVIKVNDDGINPMGNFTGTTTDIYIKIFHTWGCPVYFLDVILQGNIYGLYEW